MNYSAIMIDIIGSKKLPINDREDIQVYVKKCLNTLNELFKPSLVFDVVFSAGDEVQGLFKNPLAPYLYFRLLKMILDPVQIRCGIGVGDWDVKIKGGISTEQDGSAFHNARDAIEQAHKKSELSVLYKTSSKNDLYINSLISTSFDFIQKQTKQQRTISLLIELMTPLYSEKDMNISIFVELMFLIRNKDLIKFFNTKTSNFEISDNFINIDDFHPIIIQDALYNNKIYNDSTLIKGLSQKLTDLLGTSRQNIEKSINRSNIEIIRNLDLTALMYIYDNFRG